MNSRCAGFFQASYGSLRQLIDEAIESHLLELYAALYELSDKELIDRLKLLGDRAHLVLANGSDKQGDGN